jgi:hypothetical protein
MFSLLVWTTLASLPAPPVAAPPELTILVHARVSRMISRDELSQINTFVIEHVYLGEQDLLKQAFEVRCFTRKGIEALWERGPLWMAPGSDQPSTQSRPDQTLYFDPPLHKGEEGIWWLRKEPKKGRLVPYYPYYPSRVWDENPARLATPAPARKVLDTANELYRHFVGGIYVDTSHYSFPYRDALQWARTVEQIAAAPAEQRLTLLKEHCRSDNRHIAAWCVRALAKHRSAANRTFLRELALDKDSSVSAQIAVDDVLLAIDAPQWRDSKERRRLLTRWLSGEIDDDEDFSFMSDHIRQVLRRKQLDWSTWLPLLLRFEEVNGGLKGCCYRWMELLRDKSPEAEMDRAFVFKSMLKELQGTKGHRREVIAEKFAHLYPLADVELAAADALARQTSDEDLSPLLKIIHRKSELRRQADERLKAPSTPSGVEKNGEK